MRPRHAFGGVLAVLASPVSCVGSGDVAARDRTVWSPAAQLEWRIASPTVDSPQRLQGDMDFEARASHASAHGELDLEPGETVAFSGRTFTGPAELDLDWTVDAASLAFRGGFSVAGRAGLQGLVGVAGQRVAVHLADLSDAVSSYGPLFGAEVHVRPLERLELYGRVSVLFGLFGAHTNLFHSITDEVEAGARFRVVDHVQLFGSWRWWSFRQEREAFDDDDDFSDYRLRLSGPLVGVSVYF